MSDDFRSEVHEFCLEWAPRAARYEADEQFPHEIYDALGARRWLGALVPCEYGGMGGGVREFAVMEEEFARHGLPILGIQVQAEMLLLNYGTEEQKQHFLPKLATGELVSCTAMTEPLSGSKLADLVTTATVQDDKLHVVGKKTHINLAERSDIMMVLALNDESRPSFYVIEKEQCDRFRATYKLLKPIALKSSPVYNVFLEDVVCEPSALLGPPGGAIDMVKATFNVSRIGNAAFFVGRSRRILQTALEYANRRRIGSDHVVTDFQGIQWIVSDLTTKLWAASLMVNEAARQMDAGTHDGVHTSMAKIFAADLGSEVAARIGSIVGGPMAFESQPYAAFANEIASIRVEGGSIEILRNHVGKKFAKSPALLAQL